MPQRHLLRVKNLVYKHGVGGWDEEKRAMALKEMKSNEEQYIDANPYMSGS